MRKITKYLFLALFIGASSFAYADDEFGVSFVKAPSSVEPGNYETFVIQVSNYLNEPIRLNASVQLPENWKVLSGPRDYPIPPLASVNVVYLIEVLSNCEAGEKELTFLFHDTEKGFSSSTQIFSRVEKNSHLELEQMNVPRIVQENESFTLEYMVLNQGNLKEVLRVASTQEVEVVPENFELNIGESQRIKVTYEAKMGLPLRKITSYYANFSIFSLQSKQELTRTEVVKVIPENKSSVDPYHRYPLRVGGSYVGGRNSGEYADAMQFLVSGNGYLDHGNNHKLRILLRGPNRFQVSRLGNFDQYFLHYQNESFGVLLGDHSFRISQLLESGRFARGVSVEQTIGNWHVGGKLYNARFTEGLDWVSSVFSEYRLESGWNFRLTGMRKDLEEEAPVHLASGEIKVKKDRVSAEGEFSASLQDGSNLGYGGRLELSTKWNNLSVNLNGLYSDQNFKGFFNNSLVVNSNLSYSLKNLQIGGSVRINSANPSLDTFQVAAPFTSMQQVFLGYQTSQRDNFFLAIRRRTGEDRFEPKRFDYEERSLLARFRMSRQDISLLTEVQYGLTENFLAAEGEAVQTTTNIGLQGSCQVARNLSVSGLSRFLRTNRYNADLSNIFLYGGSVSYRLTGLLTASVNYRNNYLLEQVNEDRSILNTSLKVNWGGHEIQGFLSYNIFRNTVDQRNYFLSLSYAYKLNIGISKRKDIATLSGRVIPSGEESVDGIVLKMAGITAVTDENGFFQFTAVRPGTYHLLLDKTTIGIFQQTRTPMPLEVELGPVEKKSIAIELITTGELKGHIQFDLKPETQKPDNLIIRLKNEHETKVIEVKPSGEFRAIQLRPGSWEYDVIENGWEEKFRISPMSGTIDIRSGQASRVDLTMKQKEEKIIFKN